MKDGKIIQEIRNARRDLAGIMQKAERIEAALVGMAGLVGIRVLERGNDAVQGSGEDRKEYVA